MGIAGVIVLFSLGILASFFRRTKLDDWWGFLKKEFLILNLKGVMEKWVGCFLVYLFLRGLFFYKKVLRGGRFNFLRETYPPKLCNTRYYKPSPHTPCII